MNKTQAWVSIAIGAIAVAGAIANAALAVSNRTDRSAIDDRERFVRQVAAIGPLYDETVAVATRQAQQLGDPVLAGILAKVGVQVVAGAASGAASTGSATAGSAPAADTAAAQDRKPAASEAK